jgi:hypothetical protein
MDTDSNLEQSNIIFDELVKLLYWKNNTEVIKKYNELSPDLKKLILYKTTDDDNSLLLLACEYKLIDLIFNIINDCINLGIEHVLNKANYYGITPLIMLIQNKLYNIALILLKSKYSNPNYKTKNNILALDILIVRSSDEFFKNNTQTELFILLVDSYLDDDTVEYTEDYEKRIIRITDIINSYGLKQHLSDETKSKLNLQGSNNYFNIRKFIPKFIPKFDVNKHNRFTNIQSPSLNSYNNHENSIQEVEATYNHIPETNATRNIVSPLAHAEVLHNEPFPYHMVYEDETPFLINNPHNNINPVVNIPINQPFNLPKKPIKTNIMNSLFKISEKLNLNNNTTNNKPKSREELSNIQADAAEKRWNEAKLKEMPPAKLPKPNVTVKAPPIKPRKPNVTVKALPIKPPKPNVTVKALPIKPPKPIRGGSKTRKVKSQTKNKRKYNKKIK